MFRVCKESRGRGDPNQSLLEKANITKALF